MKVVSSEAIYEEDKKYVKCEILADTTPATMPEAEDIDGYDDSFELFPGSTMYIITTGDLYMSGEDGDWHIQ